jgi:hypothetical protein
MNKKKNKTKKSQKLYNTFPQDLQVIYTVIEIYFHNVRSNPRGKNRTDMSNL